jgi:hypothetical protein
MFPIQLAFIFRVGFSKSYDKNPINLFIFPLFRIVPTRTYEGYNWSTFSFFLGPVSVCLAPLL